MKIIKMLSLFALSLMMQIGVVTADNLPIAEGKFEPTDQSLKQYEFPEWFRDAKFGIWSHWGPQAVPEQGDWYARRMYCEESIPFRTGKRSGKVEPHYEYHKKTYGHPSVFGYKDIIPLWKAEKFDPDALMKLYKKAGAKYFVSMGVHHDNFFLWDSKLHRWNSVQMGPKRDIVGDWKKAADKEGLKFGISEHLSTSYTWFQSAKGADTKGEYKGVPYDGADPKYQDLYHKPLPESEHTAKYTSDPELQREWFYRMKEVIDMYDPDLFYSDGPLPFGDVGRSLVAHLYNNDMKVNKELNAVYNCKEESHGRFVRDLERGVVKEISPYPWQTDTSIGNWFYNKKQGYASSTKIIQMLIDIVSKNGNLLINVVQTPAGDLQDKVVTILEEIAVWIEVNGEAIYGTRPWSVFGEGPSLEIDKNTKSGSLKSLRSYLPGDLRFTTKGDTLYAFAMEKIEGDITISSIPKTKKVKSVRMLGSKQKISFSRKPTGELVIKVPAQLPEYTVAVFEIK